MSASTDSGGAAADTFGDVVAANRSFARGYQWSGLKGRARRGLAVVTCIDTRLDPLAMLGLEPGDAKILRTAGARITDDVLRSLIVATHVLGVERIAVIHHTDCGLHSVTQPELEERIGRATGEDASAWDFLTFVDQASTLGTDLEKIRSCSLLRGQVVVRGFIFDVSTGMLEEP